MSHVDIIGAERIKAMMGAMAMEMEGSRADAALAACHVFERYAKYYATGHGGGPHVQTGNLLNSIQSRKTASDEAQVAPSMDYAAYVEYGTSRSAQYPYMRPAWEDGKKEAEKVLTERLGRVISLSGKTGGRMGIVGGSTGAYNAPLPED